MSCDGAPLVLCQESPPTRKPGRYLLDCSAWSRVQSGQLDYTAIRKRYAGPGSMLVTTTIQLLEILFTAQSPAEWERLHTVMARYPLLHANVRTHRIATGIQRRLWQQGRKRAAGSADIYIAAIAVQYDTTVVHYDNDFEHIGAVAPEFRHEWVAQRGTL
ncbi:PIN domain-containing protein [Nocardia sp. JCM 34519]|uniref:PIN domain-containing protein n=1 Tax=Nocardia sp. JCM 34519 TaxID=2876118 RepID=UPI001CE45FC2|nr:PIN domain-containing protein [Nocardia sp. JCM 34519]